MGEGTVWPPPLPPRARRRGNRPHARTEPGSGLLISPGHPEKAGLWPYRHWRSSQNHSGPQFPRPYNGCPLAKDTRNTCFMPGTATGTRKVAVNKTEVSPGPREPTSSRKRQTAVGIKGLHASQMGKAGEEAGEGSHIRHKTGGRSPKQVCTSQADLEAKHCRRREQQVGDRSTCPRAYCQAGGAWEEAGGRGGAGEALRTGPGPRSGLTDDARCSRWCLSQFPAGLFIHPVASELLEGVVITPILHVRTLRLEKGGAVSHALSAGGRALLPQVRGGKWPPGQHPGWDSGYSALSMWHQTGREKDGEVGEGANAPEPVRARPIFAGIWG